MKKYFYMLILLGICGIVFFNATSQSSSSSEDEIGDFIREFVNRWNQHDPKQLQQLWADNGDIINPAGEWEKGRDNVVKILNREHQGLLRESRMQQEVTNIIMLTPTLAWVDASVKLTMPMFKEGLDHHIVFLLIKENNQWRILAARPYQFLELHLGLFESPHA